MPNKTIYVPESDLPLFEKAQKLAGENLSGAIVQALRRFIQIVEAKNMGYEEVTLKVGSKEGFFQKKQFLGKRLVKWHRRTHQPGPPQPELLEVYQTAKGRFALYIRNAPGGMPWPRRGWRNWENSDEYWAEHHHNLRLEVYETLDELKKHVPNELYTLVVQSIRGEEIEFLDI